MATGTERPHFDSIFAKNHHTQSHRPRRVTETRVDGYRNRVVRSTHHGASHRRCRLGALAFYLTKLARLGGYLARAADPPPGNVSSGADSPDSLISNSAPKSE